MATERRLTDYRAVRLPGPDTPWREVSTDEALALAHRGVVNPALFEADTWFRQDDQRGRTEPWPRPSYGFGDLIEQGAPPTASTHAFLEQVRAEQRGETPPPHRDPLHAEFFDRVRQQRHG